MKLYYSKGACSLAIRILIHEMNIACEFELVNLAAKQTEKGEDYWAINSKGSVPALLTDDNQLLTENAIIQQYLADTYQATQLLPAIGDFKRYRVLEWLNFVSTDLHKGFNPFFNSQVPQELRDTVFMPILKKRFAFVDKHLANLRYLNGDQFTLPDAYLFVVSQWLVAFNVDTAEWTNLHRYLQEIKQRPAVQKALIEEGLS